MIKIKRENVASISFSMFIIKCIFFIYLFSVNIYSYPVGNERHKVVSIFDLQKLSWLCNAIQTPMKISIIILVRWNVTLEQMEVRLSVLKYLSTVFTSYHILYQ